MILAISLVTLVLALFAAVNVFNSIWFRFWASKKMEDRAKREFYVRSKYDIKWSFSFAVVAMLGSFKFWLLGLQQLSGWNLLISLLFWFYFWGNYRTLKIEKDRLDRKKDFEI